MKIAGLREAQANLNKLKDIGDRVSFADMFPPEFIEARTRHPSMEALVDASGFEVNSEEDFRAIPDEDWERHIADNTDFDSWEEMQKVAFEVFIQRSIEK